MNTPIHTDRPLLTLGFTFALTVGLLGCGGKGAIQEIPVAAAPAAAEDLEPEPPDLSEWPLFRGDELSSGVATSALPEQPSLQWEMRVENGAFESTAAISKGVVYLADLDGVVYALDLKTGDERWRFETDSGFLASPALKNDRLYLGDYDGKLWCLTTDGKLAWEFETEAEIDSSVNFYKDNVVVGSQDATLYCLNAASGELVWKYEIADQIRCCPTVVEGRAFVAGCDGQLHMIDLEKGEATDSVDLEGPTGVTPAVMGDHVFVGTEGGLFLGINWRKAEETWRFEDVQGQQAYRGAAAASPKYVVVGSRDKRLRSFEPLTGKELWSFAAKGRIDSSPVIASQRVYFGASDGRVYGLSLETGKELWQYEAGGGFTASPAIAQGRMVIASDDGVVYCFGK